jgi:hypothetical protein
VSARTLLLEQLYVEEVRPTRRADIIIDNTAVQRPTVDRQ